GCAVLLLDEKRRRSMSIALISRESLRNQEAVCGAERAVGDGRGGGGRARGGGKPGLSGAAWGGGAYGERRRCGRRTRGAPGVRGDGRAIRRSTRTSGRWLGMEDAQCDEVGGRRLALQRVHDDATEKSVVRSVVAAEGSRSGGARHHGGGRGAYGTRTRRSSGERSQRGHRVRSI